MDERIRHTHEHTHPAIRHTHPHRHGDVVHEHEHVHPAVTHTHEHEHLPGAEDEHERRFTIWPLLDTV